MRVHVTLEDIALGIRRNSCECPIARAIKREYQMDCEVYPSFGKVLQFINRNEDSVYEAHTRYSLPFHASQWAADFDEGKEVGPFEFELGE